LTKTKVLAVGLSTVLGFLSEVAVAREIWVVRFQTSPPELDPQCQPLTTWNSHLMFHNTTATSLEVNPLSVSGGSLPQDARPLQVPAGSTVSLRGRARADLNWEAEDGSTLWVNKLEVPDGIVVTNRGETAVLDVPPSPPPCPGIFELFAGFPMPARSDLVGAGQRQYHLGVDTGGPTQGNDTGDTRINVGVFNASLSPAQVTIEVRCSGAFPTVPPPDPLVDTEQFVLGPNSVIQVPVVTSTLATGCPVAIGGPSPWHVVVTSDQPGFSYAAGIRNGVLPKLPVSASVRN
jgi:hypothetical protein